MAHATVTWVNFPPVERKLVHRWQGHPACEYGYRLQSNDDHRRELQELFKGFLHWLSRERKPVFLDVTLLAHAVKHHDDGEDFLGDDVLYVNKTGERDLLEYQAFKSVVEPHLVTSDWALLHRAFLLQFVRKYHSSTLFPSDAVLIMKDLSEMRWNEVLTFDCLERIDYLLYADEQERVLKNPHFICEVFPNQEPKLEDIFRLAPWLKGFYESFSIHEKFQKILREHGSLSVR
ncbi:MAG TPA: hypothetical protein VGA06_00225 [Candidatus Paceibacterota bacterium]|jgi:hypothetical protein